MVNLCYASSLLQIKTASHKLGNGNCYFFPLHLSLQYFTSSQTFSHFFLHVNGLLQTMQIFCCRFSFLICLLKIYYLIERLNSQETFQHFHCAHFFFQAPFYQKYLPTCPASDFFEKNFCAHP